MLNNGLFTSDSIEWGTPKPLFESVHEALCLNIDVCASSLNACLPRFYSKQDDAFQHEWNLTFWMNPPYGREIKLWVEKAVKSASFSGLPSALLVPARTDTAWFQLLHYCYFIFFIGRIKFTQLGSTGLVPNNLSAPFPSVLALQNVNYNKAKEIQENLQDTGYKNYIMCTQGNKFHV